MSTIFKIKRSTGAGAPTTANLQESELAYSQDQSSDGANSILYIESVDNAAQPVIHKIGGKYYTDIIDAASSSATASAIIRRDAQSNFAANTITANTFIGGFSGTFSGKAGSAGIADTANALTTARLISLSGDISGSALFDGSANITISTSVQPDSVALGTDTTGDYVQNVDAGTGIVASGGGGEDSSITISLENTAVSPNTYGGSTNIPAITVDQQGRITDAQNVAISTSFTLAADSGASDTFNNGGTLTFTGGTGIATSVTNDTITVTNQGVVSIASGGHGITFTSSNGAVTANFTGVGSVVGTSNEIEVTNGPTGNVTIGLPNDIIIGNDLTVTGNLYVMGNATAIHTTELVVEDPLVKFGNANPTSALDIGFYGEYNDSGIKYVGLFADSSDSYTFKLFKDLTVDPVSNVIDLSSATLGTLRANLTGANITSLATALAVDSGGTGRATLTANAVLFGNSTNEVGLATGTSGQVLQIGSDGGVKFDIIDGGTY
jgi:hypothetical protein